MPCKLRAKGSVLFAMARGLLWGSAPWESLTRQRGLQSRSFLFVGSLSFALWFLCNSVCYSLNATFSPLFGFSILPPSHRKLLGILVFVQSTMIIACLFVCLFWNTAACRNKVMAWITAQNSVCAQTQNIINTQLAAGTKKAQLYKMNANKWTKKTKRKVTEP